MTKQDQFVRMLLLFSFINYFLVACQTTAVETAGITPAAATPTTSSEPDTQTVVTAVVPPILESTTPPNATAPWQTALSACAVMGRDQICYGDGDVQWATQAPSNPGETVALASVRDLQFGSQDKDGLVLLRLSADLENEDEAITIIALGRGEIVALETRDEEAVGDIAALFLPDTGSEEDAAAAFNLDLAAVDPPSQQMIFYSQATDRALPSGLLILSPANGHAAAIGINGTTLLLSGSAWVTASFSGEMMVQMVQGVASVTAEAKTEMASPQTEVLVSLNEAGQPAAAPRAQATTSQPHTATLQAMTAAAQFTTPEITNERIEAAIEAYRRMELSYAIDRFDRSIKLCLAGGPNAARYVYNSFYWLRVAELRAAEITNGIPFWYDQAKLLEKAQQCATFEVDYNATITLGNEIAAFTGTVHAEGLRIQFTPGGPFIGAQGTLQYVSLTTVGMDVPGCNLVITHPDGTLQIDDGSLAIVGDGMRISLNILPNIPQESFIYDCGAASSYASSPFNFMPLYMGLYADIFRSQGFTIRGWHYVGGELMAEVFLDRSVIVDGAEYSGTTHLVLVHTPQVSSQ